MRVPRRLAASLLGACARARRLRLAPSPAAAAPRPHRRASDGRRPRLDAADRSAQAGARWPATSRDQFPHWRDAGENCDVRDAVLKRDGTGVQAHADLQGHRGHLVQRVRRARRSPTRTRSTSTTWCRWRTPGARAPTSWTDDQRGDFANDLTRPQLLAVSAGDQPVEGRPGPVPVEAGRTATTGASTPSRLDRGQVASGR